MSRIDKSIKNAKVALFFFIISTAVAFVSRKLLLLYLGDDLIGLNATLSSVLGFLGLTELGIGLAISYALYAPLASENKTEIIEIITVQGWLYKRIAFAVMGFAALIMCFFPILFKNISFPIYYCYLAFSVFLFDSLITYLINYPQIVLTADQKDYKLIGISQSSKILKVGVQLFALHYLKWGYLGWLFIELTVSIFMSLYINYVISKEYPWLKTKIAQGKELSKKYGYILKKTKQVFFHKIATFVLHRTSPFILYMYTTLGVVALYANYMMIITGVTMMVESVFSSVQAGVGNLVAEGDTKKSISVFWEFTVLRYFVTTIACLSLFHLVEPFVKVWIGSTYLMDTSTLYLLIGMTFLFTTRVSDTFISAYGMYEDIYAPVIETFINISLSVTLGYFFGLNGVISGILISLLLVVFIWKPIFLFSKGFKSNPLEYFTTIFGYIIIIGAIFLSSNFVIKKIVTIEENTLPLWLLKSSVTLICLTIISLIFFYTFSRSFRLFFHKFTLRLSPQ